MAWCLAYQPVVHGAVEGSVSRPHVLLIVADDLGFSDLGCYGGEIKTPHLDRLAQGGLRFTQFYNTARCWPTRAALLTGYYAQQVRRDTVPGVTSGGAGVRPAWARLLPELLSPAGYRCYHSGKWHLDGKPLEGGFDRSYLLQDQGRYFHPRVHLLNDEPLQPVEPGTDFYATVEIADRAIEQLQEHAAQHAGQPFFQYVAFTAPHFPLQALSSDIARYAGRYDAGWEIIRQARWERIQELGLLAGRLPPPLRDLGPPYHFPDALELIGPAELNRPLSWSELTDEQRSLQAIKMSVHAAMIDCMDQQMGRLVDQLNKMGCLHNTLILFLSDNGASAEIMVRDDGHDPQAAAGSASSYLCLGPGWSTVANTPFQRHKTWVHQGGIATPLIAHWPAGIRARGELRTAMGHVIDIAPTVLELAGSRATDVDEKVKPPQRPGASLLPVLASDRSIHDELWWAHEGNRALRRGDWKLVAARDEPWQLYNLAEDPTEMVDLAARHPERLAEMSERWQAMMDEFEESARQ